MVSVLPNSEFPDCIGVVADSSTSKVRKYVNFRICDELQNVPPRHDLQLLSFMLEMQALKTDTYNTGYNTL